MADIIIAGSGFAGSILAMGLRKLGYRVTIIEKSKHPRFAIGESSTPIADMILRELAITYNLPVLGNLSRYGNWQKHYPEVLCGLKRGFSYYEHQPHMAFRSDSGQHSELHVAASTNDLQSDTNWYRHDTDQLLVKEAQKEGALLLEETEILHLERDSSSKRWIAAVKKEEQTRRISAKWILDCTGSPWFSERFFGVKSSAVGFRTNTSAIFSHFSNVPFWSDHLAEHGGISPRLTYNPDHSALHHLIDEGWLWMLRFQNGLLSGGLVLDNHVRNMPDFGIASATARWNAVIHRYPSLKMLFESAIIAEKPGKLVATGRLQRRMNRVYGEGWMALPHTAGFVDPMHSTGIAHTLTGVERILSFFRQPAGKSDFSAFGKTYQEEIFSELDLIDILVSLCYRTRKHFELFHASVMLYFTATVYYEQKRLSGEKPGSFLCAGHNGLRKTIAKSAEQLDLCVGSSAGLSETKLAVNRVRELISPYNRAGLLDPEKKKNYTHTAVKLGDGG